MDEARLAETIRWGRELARRGESSDLRAAGRAILLLADELEAARGGPPSHERPPSPPPEPEEEKPRRSRRARPGRDGTLLRALRGRSRRLPLGRVLAACAAVALAVTGVAGAKRMLAPSLSVLGPAPGAQIGSAALPGLAFQVDGGTAALAQQRWTLDGRRVDGLVRAQGARLVFRPRKLAEGSHELVVRRGGGFLGTSTVRRLRFTVDRTPPALTLAHATAHAWEPLTLTGAVEGATTLSVDRHAVPLEGGRFVVHRAPPLPRTLELRAVDAAGNVLTRSVPVEIVPRRPAAAVRAVHVTFYGWADRTLRAGVMALIAQRRINAVELDLKDESGIVGFDPAIPLGRRIGAVQKIYDLRQAVQTLHAKGIRVIGRIVCFRDPILAAAAWKAGNRDQVVQTPGGGPYSGYGGFTNFANPVVRRYNADVAVAGAKLGVDDILYDYVRRPDGPIGSMVFPGLKGTPERSIASFLGETRLALRPWKTYLGASVFGVAANRPKEVAQDIPQMARQVDYIAPMVYPSHWGAGEWGVASPNSEPYEIVRRSLRAFQQDVAGTGARIVPWLQDFSLGVTYGPAEVRAQISAARRDGVGEFILWDAAVTYTADALDPNAVQTRAGLASAKAGTTTAAAPVQHHARVAAAPAASAGRPPNELGVVPVLMHHEIRPDRVGDYDQTPAEFRAELAQLWRQGYWPVRAIDLVTGKLDVPAGKTPVVMTFDDSTQYQFSYTAGGAIKPDTAIGIMLDFARAHPGFKPAGTFYVNREPFAGVARGPAMLRWLVAHGFELGDHTKDHIQFGDLNATQVQREIVLGANVIADAVPGYRARTLALPLGVLPKPASLALRGSWSGTSYREEGVFLVGAGPAPSPFSSKFDPGAIPRIRSSHLPWHGEADYTAAFWLDQLRRNPEERYVSDGDPGRISFPAGERSQLAARFQQLARAY